MNSLINSFRLNCSLDSLQSFINDIDYNNDQKNILNNLKYSKFYFVDYQYSVDNIKITILGDLRNSKRHKYSICFDKNRGNFTCNCKDFQYRSHSKNIVCKHISFIICKILKILDHGYFKTKKIANSVDVLSIISNKANWEQYSLNFINKQFKSISFDKNDQCIICYNELSDNDVINCPRCLQCIHTNCMERWLIRSNQCVYCRSNIFLQYEKLCKTMKNCMKL